MAPGLSLRPQSPTKGIFYYPTFSLRQGPVLSPSYTVPSPSAPAPGSPACSAGPDSCEGPSPSPASPPGAGPSALHSPTPPGDRGVAGSWVGEPCPTSSLTRGKQYPSYSLPQFLVGGVGGVRRRQTPTSDQGPSRSPAPTVPGQGGYLLLLRGSPTEPRVLLHKAGILILGFSQLQFLGDQRNSEEWAQYPHSSSPHTEDTALPDKAFLPHLEPCISQERRAPQHRRECS